MQPYIVGNAVSAAGVVSDRGVAVLPAVQQLISRHARLHYTGGIAPAQSGWDQEVGDLTVEALKQIPGLWGYAGVDMIIPQTEHHADPPIVMEINPRLTTSYLGYRCLTDSNLAERIVDPDPIRPALQWTGGSVEFGTDGTTRVISSQLADSLGSVPGDHFLNLRDRFSWQSPIPPSDHLEL